jgi:quinol monooxygenase YgiN
MREEISWVCSVTVKPGLLAEFKQVVAPLVAATKEEPGALAYEYHVGDDQSTVHIFERYRDSNAVVAHVEQTFARFAERFIALATVTGFIVYGTPNAEARKILDGFGAVYMTPFDGFTR